MHPYPVQQYRGEKKKRKIYKMAKKQMKKCRTFLAINKINANQNHVMIHFTLVKMATIKNTNSNKCWRGCGEQ
jgi:hypothetical protein